MAERKLVRHSSAEFLVFTAEGTDSIEVRFDEGTIWLTQKLMAELFGVDVRTVNEHLGNIFESEELEKGPTIRNFRIVRMEGSREVARTIEHYNLDAIISVGYRVNSKRATQFRQWATKVLRDFTLRGYVLDRDRMATGEILGEDYFEQLLQEIREIRLSERRFYQKVTDIYATAVDYHAGAPETKQFFAMVQNKLHYAVHRHTAAELIRARADAEKPHMGLTSWKNSPDGKVLRSDVTIAKNYLTKHEIEDLGRLVDAYLNLAESRARRKIPTTMQEWAAFLDDVLALDSRERLADAGSIAKRVADKFAVEQYESFRVRQDAEYVSDYDEFERRARQTIDEERGDG